MYYLLLGSDDFSKNEYVGALAKRAGLAVSVFVDAENPPKVEELAQQDLFSKPQIFVLKGLVAKFSQPETVENLIKSKNFIIFNETKLDKRLGDNKKLLANTSSTTQEFNLPHGRELNGWIEERVIFLGGSIGTSAIEALAFALGRDDAKETKFGGKVVEVAEVYDLWQADSEIRKLIAYADGKEIAEDDIHQLVQKGGEVDVFDLTNAIADNQKQKALELLHKFLLPQSGSDEKGAIIQLNALLSEQFRNVAMVQDFLGHKTSDNQILEATGWKSGRLFVIKKIAGKFTAKKILDFLNKLKALDEELKTSSTPPKVLLDLIVAQLL